MRTTAGPGRGPNGVPLAIAVSPILSARVRARDLERIQAAAPGSRIVNLSVEGLADGPVDDIEVLLRGWLVAEAFDRLLARAPHLAWVHSATSGVERALTPAALARDVVVTNARGVFSRPIAEHVLLMILAISRHLPDLVELQRERTWQPLEGRELRELTIGIVGYGSLGRSVASLATAFGVPGHRDAPAGRRVGGRNGARSADDPDAFPIEPRVERIVGPEGLRDLLAESDIVVLAAPLTPETESMIDEAAIAAMKRDAWLINVARGRLIDDRALLRALRDNRIGGAALDAFRDEPLPQSSPYWELPNVILTPHTAWSSTRVLDRSIDLFCDNLVRFSRGRGAPERRRPRSRLLIELVRRHRGVGRSARSLTHPTRCARSRARVRLALGTTPARSGALGADRDRRACRERQDDRLQHPDARPRRDGWLRRPDAERRGRQGAGRAARPARRDLQAEEGRPGRRHLRRPARAAAVDRRGTSGPRSCRPSTSRGCASPTRCCTSFARSTTHRCRTRTGRSMRPATSSGWTSSSSSPTCRWSIAASTGSARAGATARPPSANRTSARKSSFAGSRSSWKRAGPSATPVFPMTRRKAVRGFRFLTEKPVLVLLNVGEAEIGIGPGARGADRRRV